MRRSAKTKITSAARVLPRKAKLAAGTARAFPAWVDPTERGVSFSAAVMPRVRDGLVLRVVARGKKTVTSRRTSDGSRAR